MSTTALDLVSGAMRLLGALSAGEVPSSSEAADGLSSLNRMLDSWGNEELLIPSETRTLYALTANQQTYTLGTGGSWSATRPTEITKAGIILNSSTPAIELPMFVLNADQWAGVILKGTTSSFPIYLYPDYAYPLTTVSVWPVPTSAVNQIALYTMQPIARLTTLTTALSLQPGFEEAIIYNLAVRLAPEYGKAIREEIADIAISSKASIKRVNNRPALLRVDRALQPAPGVWNWLTGEPT